jgi:tetratricopeptide (TPR) repeat protein
MKVRAAKPTLWAWMAAAGLSAAPLTAPPEAGAAGAADAVARLSDDSFAIRQAATRELWRLGENALPELKRAAEGADPEAALRARELMRKIELGILPDSSPKIVDLVMRYDRGGIDERRKVIGELRMLRAWRQILKLYALEKDDAVLLTLETQVRGVAIEAARDCLGGETLDIAGAFTYLEMARPEPSELMAMAALHRSNGTLEEELEKSKPLGGKEGHLWRFALHAAAGNLEAAAGEAQQAGLELAAARLKLLAGDPLPWIKEAPAPPQTLSALSLPHYREFATRRWQGKEIKPELTRQFRRLARAGDEDERPKSLRLLFLTGDHEEAEKVLVARDPSAAFYYLESAERIEEALKAYGLDPEKPDYAGWAMKRFRVLIDDPDEEMEELTELALLGYFLERRGLTKELEEAFVAPLAELAKTDQEIFIRTASRLFSGPYGTTTLSTVWPVIRAAAAYAGEDEVRWMQIVENLFDGYKRPDRLWTWTATVEPAMDRVERLELLCRLYGRISDPGDQRGKFFDHAWAIIEKTEGPEKLVQLGQFIELSDLRGLKDSRNFLRGIEALAKINPEGAAEHFAGYHYSGSGRWAEAAAEWMRLCKRSPSYPSLRAYAASCYRRAGDEAAAAEQEKIAEMMAMGETDTQVECGSAFALAGDFERATRWWRRAAVECTGNSLSFLKAIYYLNQQAFSAGDWKTAAVLAEALALQEAMTGSDDYGVPVAYGVSSSLRMRIDADMARAFSKLGEDRAGSVAEIERISSMPFADLSLADYFFAPMREAGLVKQHDQAFDRLWQNLVTRIARYPGNDNTRNSAAWLASRANRHLDEAEDYLEKAIENNPRQAAYLDTMAEVHFARGDREKAVEISARGLKEEPEDFQLVRQHERFKSGAFPPK